MENSAKSKGRVFLQIDGMSCASCARKVEQALSQVPGVAKATVELRQNFAVIEGSAPSEDLIAAVDAIGYEARATEEATIDKSADKASGCCC